MSAKEIEFRPTLQRLDRRDVGIVYNPHAGGQGGSRQVEKEVLALEAFLEREGFGRIDSEATKGSGDATSIGSRFIADGRNILVGFGGDGTAHELAQAQGLIVPESVRDESSTIFVALPGGSQNVFHKMVGFSSEVIKKRDPVGALEQALDWPIHPIDTIESRLDDVQNDYALLMVGIGIDGRAAAMVESMRKRGMRGRWVPWVAAAGEILRNSYQNADFTLEDGELRRIQAVQLVVVGNSANYAGVVDLRPEALLDDGQVEISGFKGKNPIKVVHDFFVNSLRLPVKGISNADYFSSSSAKIVFPVSTEIQMDGEAIGRAKVIELFVAKKSLLTPLQNDRYLRDV